jgi:hypothetical protein
MKGGLHYIAKDLDDGLAPLLDELLASLDAYVARHAACGHFGQIGMRP